MVGKVSRHFVVVGTRQGFKVLGEWCGLAQPSLDQSRYPQLGLQGLVEGTAAVWPLGQASGLEAPSMSAPITRDFIGQACVVQPM